MTALVIRFLRETRGATAVEYGLLLGLLVLAIVVGAGNFGDELGKLWNTNSATIRQAINGN